MTNENVWDTSHFIQQYTTKSSHQRSPLKNEIFNLSREISVSPDRLAEELIQDDVFCTSENLESRLQHLNQVSEIIARLRSCFKQHSAFLRIVSKFCFNMK